MIGETQSGPWTKAKATNFTSSFATLRSTLTKPVIGDAIIAMAHSEAGGIIANNLLIRPFGTDTNNNTFKLCVVGWDRCLVAAGVYSWEMILLAELLCTFGNIQGATGCAIAAADFEVDTIALTYGNDDVSIDIVSPANDVRGASFAIDCKGCQIVQVDGDLNASAASWNFLYKKY